jgi:acyl-CoA synthetase (AMP-forming)/AMP-acid ligase II
MPPNPNQPPSHNSTVRQLQRLSVIRGPSNPPLLNLTFGELTRRQNRKHADEIAVISHQQNEIITYSQLHKYSDDLAAGMIALGINKGDRVAVLLGNRSEYVHVRRSHYFLLQSIEAEKTNTAIQLLLACAKIGAMITLLNYAYSHTEIMAALATTSELAKRRCDSESTH